ncbi:hypothetical protein H9P43_006487 [Blastocladiella emersonii ATCC 22665]|nr:hypothetical protein H9P43_006487 [Blastocladiella emersonii ATCC 22665]
MTMDAYPPAERMLRSWVAAELETLGLQEEGMEDYIVGILVEDEEMIPRDDKIEGVVGYLTMTFESLAPEAATAFVEQALDKHAEFAAVAEAEAALAEVKLDDAATAGSGSGSDSDSDSEEHYEDASGAKSATPGPGKKLITKEEARRRRAILAQYKYEDDGEAELMTPKAAAVVSGEIPVRRKNRKNLGLTYEDIIGMPNDNSKKVSDAEAAKRAAMQAEHAQKKSVDKANLAKQRAQQAADKEKKKSVKQERRRM